MNAELNVRMMLLLILDLEKYTILTSRTKEAFGENINAAFRTRGQKWVKVSIATR